MDGARLWECGPFYDRPYAEIAALFDTTYVSFYKVLGGLAGAALAGSEEVVASARVWQQRHGGVLIRQFPYVLAAQLGLDQHLARVPAYCAKARELASALTVLPGLHVVPNPPQTHMFQLFVEAPALSAERAALEIAQQHSVWLAGRVAPTALPGVSRIEVSAGDATLDLSAAQVVDLFHELLERANA